jgi:hypothetical protein
VEERELQEPRRVPVRPVPALLRLDLPEQLVLHLQAQHLYRLEPGQAATLQKQQPLRLR